MFQRRFYGCSHLFRRVLTRTFQFVHSIRGIIHRQPEFALYLSNICRMNFEAVIFFDSFLNLFICRLFLRFSFFRSLRNCHFIKRGVVKIDFHFKMRISFFLWDNTANVSTCFVWENMSYGRTDSILYNPSGFSLFFNSCPLRSNVPVSKPRSLESVCGEHDM